MKTKEEYDQHLLQFYAETFRSYALKNGINDDRYGSHDAEGFTNIALKQYGSAINNGIALELISNLKLKHTTITDSIENFPTMFWKTAEGPELLKNLTDRTIREQSEILIKKIEGRNLLETNEIEDSLKNIIQSAKKVAFKDIHISHKMLSNFTTSLKELIEYLKTEPIPQELREIRNVKLNEDLLKINNVVLNTYIEELDKKENIEAFSPLHHFMHAAVHELSKDDSLKITKKYRPKM